MAGINARRILDALIQCMEGEIGVARLDAGLFVFRPFIGLPLATQQALAKEAAPSIIFDIEFPDIGLHAMSPSSALASERYDQIEVRIPVWSYTACASDDTVEWLQHRADTIDAISLARRALHFPPALETTLDGDATAIADGMMLGPGFAAGPVYVPILEDREQGLIRADIRGALVVTVQQPAP